MANDEHLALLEQGIDVWNNWRDMNEAILPDLSGADFHGVFLGRVNLSDANLAQANFTNANLYRADLSRARLREAYLSRSRLNRAQLCQADLVRSRLNGTDLTSADLSESDLTEAVFSETIISNLDLSNAKGLETCSHTGPSSVDYRTLQQSQGIPLNFWRGCGLPDALIEYLPSLAGEAFQFYSCFISYSSKDQDFAERLHADLQNKGVRCWFAPHDLPIGAKILDGIDEAIRLRERVVLILSESAISSDWVEDEVTMAFEEERRRDQTVLFPIRLDETVMDTNEAWASKLRARNIGDFTRWKDHDAYRATMDRILRDLKTGR